MATVTRLATRLVALIVAALAVSCAAFTPSLTPTEQSLVSWWLECFECDRALDSLRILGQRSPAATVDSLNAALLNGPSRARLIAVEDALNFSYTRDSSHAQRVAQRVLTITRAKYVSQNLGRFSDGYRARAAVGMGWIHTASAVQYLNAARRIPFPTSVHHAIVYATDSLP